MDEDLCTVGTVLVHRWEEYRPVQWYKGTLGETDSSKNPAQLSNIYEICRCIRLRILPERELTKLLTDSTRIPPDVSYRIGTCRNLKKAYRAGDRLQ